MTDTYKNVVSTSMIQLFDNNKVQLRLSGYDSALNVALWMPSIDPVTGKSTYPKEERYSILLSVDKVATLNEMIRNEILPAIDENKTAKTSLFTSKSRDKIIEIGIDENRDIYLALHIDVDPMSIIPKNTYRFNFNKTIYSKDYDSKTGELTLNQCEGNFLIFASLVNDYIVAACSVSAHSIRKGNNYTMTAIFNYLKALAAKVGATVPTTFNNNSASSTAQNITVENHSNDPTISEVESIDDLPF